jgi:hypothetical protein
MRRCGFATRANDGGGEMTGIDRNGNIYGEVNSPADIREINTQTRHEMDDVSSREDLTELKKRADYLCALSLAPSWKEKFGGESGKIMRAAKAEDRKTTKKANAVAKKHGWDADYDPWREGG